MAEQSLRRLDALLQVALRLTRSAATGRVALAQLAESLELSWIPLPWGEPLVAELQSALQESLEPLQFSEVQRVLRQAWGAPAQEELDELEPDPVQVRPTWQTHRGKIDGRAVAVKVLRPGLDKMVRQDMVLLEALVGSLRGAFPELDAAGLLREIRERVLEELDLETEAHVQRRFHRALRDHPRFFVPAPVTRLSHESVRVSEWVDGVPLAQAPERDRACALLVLFALGAARRGMALGGLDPRDVLVRPDGRIAIIDLNSTRSIEPARLMLAAEGLEAFVDADLEALGQALSQLGWLPRERAVTVYALAQETLGPFAGAEAVRLDGRAVVDIRDRLLAQPDGLAPLLEAGNLAPQDLWPARGLTQLFSTIARVGARGPWRELLRAGLREGWEAEPPG